MIEFVQQLKLKNESLFYFGLICLILSGLFLALTKLTHTQVFQVNAWYKPFKFAFSIFLFSWTMALYCSYLPDFNIRLFNWTLIILFGFEIVYIAIQAGKGQLSHFNLSTPLYSFLYVLMAIAATAVTVYSAYICWLFFSQDFPELPDYYVWSIRLGLLLFVIFSFEGFLMGSRLNHSVGAVNDNSNWFIIGWSKSFGDLRVAHFIGMHALQLIPLLSFYLLKNTKATISISLVYGLLALVTLVQALQGKPLFRPKQQHEKTAL
ncbi:MAG: hypothetical protein V4561_07380 [Bacteroidota bacterium]